MKTAITALTLICCYGLAGPALAADTARGDSPPAPEKTAVKSDDSQAKLIAALSGLAKAGCEQRTSWSDPRAGRPDDTSADQLARCFVDKNFRSAEETERLTGGDGKLKDMAKDACVRPFNLNCSETVIGAGLDARFRPWIIQIIDKDGNHDLTSRGAYSHKVFLLPEVKNASITIKGHSEVYYVPGKDIQCRNSDQFNGCKPVGRND